MGIDSNKATAQVTALIPVTSLIYPAKIPPKMPPASNKVDKSAEALSPKFRPKQIQHDNYSGI